MTKIRLAKTGNNARQELDKALSVLRLSNIEAQGKIVAVYAVLEVEESSADQALAALTKAAIHAKIQ